MTQDSTPNNSNSQLDNEAQTKVIPFTHLHAHLSKSASQKKRELFNTKDPEAEVRALNPIDFFSLVTDLGYKDAIEIVVLATKEQILSLIDLTAHDNNLPIYHILDSWLAELCHFEPGKATQFFDYLDEELQTLYLSKRFVIYDAKEEEEFVPDDVDRYLTPDGTFIVAIKVYADEEPEHLKLEKDFSPFQFLADLYYVDWRRADTMLRDAKWTITTELEEELHRVRLGRLEEMGFPPLEVAMRTYARVLDKNSNLNLQRKNTFSQDKTLKTEHSKAFDLLPAYYLEPYLAQSFFSQTLAYVKDEQLLSQIEKELIFLINAHAIVTQNWVNNLENIKTCAYEIRHLLSFGLETLSHGDFVTAARLIEIHPLQVFIRLTLFQTRPLSDLVKKVEKEKLFYLKGLAKPLLSSLEDTFLKALINPLYPQFIEKDLDKKRAFAKPNDFFIAKRRFENLMLNALLVKFLLSEELKHRPISDFAVDCQMPVESWDYATLLKNLIVKKSLDNKIITSIKISSLELDTFLTVFSSKKTGFNVLPLINESLQQHYLQTAQEIISDLQKVDSIKTTNPAHLGFIV